MTTMDSKLPSSSKSNDAFIRELTKSFGITTVGDLLHHFPRRYVQRGKLTDIASLVEGEEVTIIAKVVTAHTRQFRQRAGYMLEAVIEDDAGSQLRLAFFGKNMGYISFWSGQLKPGRYGLFAGTVGTYRYQRQLAHPEFHILDDPSAVSAEDFAAELIPIYPATRKLKSWEIGKAIRTMLEIVVPVAEPLPDGLRKSHDLIDFMTALRLIHKPNSYADVTVARSRLTWDEAFAVQVSLVQRKKRAAQWPAVARPVRPDGLLAAFDAALPYTLTAGQDAVGAEISADLSASHPMHRLLQGEVGSGKTVCALRAMLQVIDAGGQAALLAPTEVLAAQHYRSIRELLGPMGRAGELDGADEATQVHLVTGSQPVVVRRRALKAAASGEAGIVIGTHALLYDSVEFADLGLVVVDEQHRFGVEQRDALRAKAEIPPHVLVMTATPIPRTVAMTVFGDLDTSTLTELPKGRSPIATHVVPAKEKPAFLARSFQRLREEVDRGHQVYIVFPRIGGDDSAEDAGYTVDSGSNAETEENRRPTALLEAAEPLMLGPLDGLRVGILHGRLPSDSKDAVMRDFAAGKLDVVLATTVVEVGVDVPNATVMVVYDADRFGVSQLHQLRGRVGRGSAPGLCLLLTTAKENTPARQRLDAVASTLDGFALANIDLEQRREGDILGEAQSGRRSHLRFLSLFRDVELIAEARAAAERLLDEDLELSQHPALAAAVATLVDEERAEFLEKG